MVVKIVAAKNHQPTKRLADIVGLPQSTVQEGRSGLDKLYTEVLQVAFLDEQADDEFYSCFKSVVGAVILVFNPLSIPALSDILEISDIPTTLRSLHSFLIVPTNQFGETPISVPHKSFPDFLTDPKWCTDNWFFINSPICHRDILLLCLKIMNGGLKRNICQLDDFVNLKEVKDLPAQRATYIGDALKYACQFWATHLVESVSSGSDVEEVQKAIDGFFTTCFLFWLEALSLLEKLGVGAYILKNVDQWYMQVGHVWRMCESFLMLTSI